MINYAVRKNILTSIKKKKKEKLKRMQIRTFDLSGSIIKNKIVLCCYTIEQNTFLLIEINKNEKAHKNMKGYK